MADFLSTFEKVSVLDLSRMINLDHFGLAHWGIKPLSMVFAPFRHVILLDADTVFFQNPETSLYDKSYIDTGLLLFMDRTLMSSYSLPSFLATILSDYSDYAKRVGRATRGLSSHEAESGMVVIDKHRHLHALLLVCTLNSFPYQKYLYSETYGDKEGKLHYNE